MIPLEGWWQNFLLSFPSIAFDQKNAFANQSDEISAVLTRADNERQAKHYLLSLDFWEFKLSHVLFFGKENFSCGHRVPRHYQVHAKRVGLEPTWFVRSGASLHLAESLCHSSVVAILSRVRYRFYDMAGLPSYPLRNWPLRIRYKETNVL